MGPIRTSDLRAEYYAHYDGYTIFLSRLETLLRAIIDHRGIDALGVFSRIKSFESFKAKVERKNYVYPFQQTKDLCGVRIIYYNSPDLPLILEAIRASGLVIIEEEDKRKQHEINSFGYGAYHVNVKLSDEWTRGELTMLKNIVGEIQVTSISEHLWANLSHKTEYKEGALNDDNKRRLYRLASVLEIFDDYSKTLINSLPKKQDSTLTAQGLRQFLNWAFPDRDRIEEPDIHSVLQNVIHYVDSQEQLDKYWNRWKNGFRRIELETFKLQGLPDDRWREDEALLALLELADLKYWNDHQYFLPEDERRLFERERINDRRRLM